MSQETNYSAIARQMAAIGSELESLGMEIVYRGYSKRNVSAVNAYEQTARYALERAAELRKEMGQ